MAVCSACNGSGALLGEACPLCDGDSHFASDSEDESRLASSLSEEDRGPCCPVCDNVVEHLFWHIRHEHGWEYLPHCQQSIPGRTAWSAAEAEASWEESQVANVEHPVCKQSQMFTKEQHGQLRRTLELLARFRPEGLSIDARKVYQNLIDPNLSLEGWVDHWQDSEKTFWEKSWDIDGNEFFVHSETGEVCEGREEYIALESTKLWHLLRSSGLRWIPLTCFYENGLCHLVSPVPQLPPSALFQPLCNAIPELLNAALPVLDPGGDWLPKPVGTLQVVVKAQRIQLGAGDPPTLNYSGLWHVDGTAEKVKAVILYYTRVDEHMIGGDLAFIARGLHEGVEFGWKSDVEKAIREATTTVSVREGSAICFRNDELLHRVKEIHVPELREQARSMNILHFDESDAGLQLEILEKRKEDSWRRIQIMEYHKDTGLHDCFHLEKSEQMLAGARMSLDLSRESWRPAAPWKAHSVVPYCDPRETGLLAEAKRTCRSVMLLAARVRRTVAIPHTTWLNIILPMVFGRAVLEILQGRALVREFIALFIIDPEHPLEDLNRQPDKDGYMSSVPLELAEEVRARLLKEQLRKKDIGSFVVVSTGNGDCHDLYHTSGVDITSDIDRETQDSHGFTRRDHSPHSWTPVPDTFLRQQSDSNAISTGGKRSVALDCGGAVWNWGDYKERSPWEGDNPNV